MDYVNIKNCIKYMAINGCLLSTGQLCEAFCWEDLGWGAINVNTVDINRRDDHSKTVLHYAAGSGNWEAVQTLLLRGADVNARDGFDNTPLHWAVSGGRIEIVRALLVQRNVVVNAVDRNGWTPLHLAACEGKVAIVEALLRRGDVNANVADSKGRTPLHLAAKYSHVEVVEALKNRDANANARNRIAGLLFLHLLQNWSTH
jgi:ankyrin repeat protein